MNNSSNCTLILIVITDSSKKHDQSSQMDLLFGFTETPMWNQRKPKANQSQMNCPLLNRDSKLSLSSHKIALSFLRGSKGKKTQ